jgi:beta-lactamase superfamily II metal-dependent hydrolase
VDGALTVEVLPADEGDCILVTCRRAGMAPRRALIDGGTRATAARLRARLEALPADERRLDLLVVTHVDADHIAGILALLDGGYELAVDDVWFNGYRHLPQAVADRSYRQGESLTEALAGEGVGTPLPWNVAFDGAAVARGDDDPATGRVLEPLPERRWPWGLVLTVLSPSPKRLDAMHRGWQREVMRARAGEPSDQTPQVRSRGPGEDRDLEALAVATSTPDNKAPNGSSIALLLEFAGRSVLLAGDAFATVLYPALVRLAQDRGVERIDVDAFKLPHHGSQANVLLPMFDVVRARHYLVSSSGSRFDHPDDEAMARVITHGGEGHSLWFNYATDRTLPWADDALRERWAYRARYPEQEAGGITLSW